MAIGRLMGIRWGWCVALLGCLSIALAAGWLSYLPVENRQPAATLAPPLPIQRRDCDFVSSYALQVECYWMMVGEEGAKARLSIAIFRGPADGAVDPLVYIAGGPGEGGNTQGTGLAIWDEWLSRTPIRRDFVLLDPRGLSPSQPAWDCEDYSRISRALLERPLSFAEEGALIAPVLEQCLSQWQSELRERGGPVASLDAFSSLLNERDLGGALRQLGYREWNYLAVSYGTRVALLAAMRQPEVRRVILDSPYPPERGSIGDALVLWVNAFASFWRRCEQSFCPFDESRFWRLMEDLREHPIWVEVDNWRSGKSERWLLNDGRLAAALYTGFYSSELTGRVAEALDRHSRGDSRELTGILEVFFNQAFDSRFNSAIYWATECNDNRLDDEASFARLLTEAGRWRTYFASDWQHNICRSAVFHNGQLPPMEEVSVPALVAVGALDPITTEVHARALMSSLPNGYLLVQERHSHAEFFMGECGQHLIPWFLLASSEQLTGEWVEKSRFCQQANLSR